MPVSNPDGCNMNADALWEVIRWLTLPAVGGMTGLSWYAIARASEVKDELTQFQHKVAEKYVTQEALQQVEKRLTNHLERIEAKIDARQAGHD